jgi:hypothetical protein
MLISPLAVGNVSITYKITLYIIFTQATRVTEIQGAISSKYKESLLYLPNKRRQPNIFYMSFPFDVSQHFCTPNIILLL